MIINGYYDGENVVMLEKPKSHIQKNQRLKITFLDETIQEDKELQEKLDLIDNLSGLLNDCTNKEQKIFDEVLSKRVDFKREVSFDE